jgi:outer membrane protein assembly factor BamA
LGFGGADLAYNSAVRFRFAQHVAFAAAWLLAVSLPLHPQSPISISCPQGQGSVGERSISEVAFSNVSRMAVREQERIIATLKRRKYSGTPDEIRDAALEAVRDEWQNRGYFQVKVTGDAKLVGGTQSIALSVYVEEGSQYRLGGITFINNRAIVVTEALRSQFHIRDGDVFSRQKIADGLENLKMAYGSLGYINFVVVPNANIDEENKSIHVEIDCDEGKQFYISRINMAGIDQPSAQQTLKRFGVQPGKVYNKRLLDMAVKRLPAPSPNTFASPTFSLNEKMGSVAISIGFVSCPSE